MLTWSSWLAEVGRLSTLAGCGEALVLRGERRRRHMGDHEAGIEAGLRHQEGRQAAHLGVGQHGDAALGQRADLGQRDGDGVGGHGHRLGMEVAAGEDLALAARTPADCRTRALASRSITPAGEAQHVERRAHHLGLAAQGVGILHAVAIDDATCGSRCRAAAGDRAPRPRSGRAGRAPRGCAHRTACRCRRRHRPRARR